MVGQFEPIEAPRSIAVRIAEQILGRIQRGEFPVGTKLPSEAELGRQFGVSRPTVREALGALQFVGYIDSARGSGSRVVGAVPSPASPASPAQLVAPGAVLDLFEARLVLEPQVAALAARRPESAMLAEAEALIEGMSVAVTHPSLHAETDLRVHRALASVCPNEFMRAAALSLIDAAAAPALAGTRHQAWADGDLPSVWESQQHQILAAIRAGDADGAAEAAWSHLASAAENALIFLAEDPTIPAGSRDRLWSLLEKGPSSHPAALPTGSRRVQRAWSTAEASRPGKRTTPRSSATEG
ncbi:MAG: FadR/GntR family transcriptional regulator [Marmoricola sp.]